MWALSESGAPRLKRAYDQCLCDYSALVPFGKSDDRIGTVPGARLADAIGRAVCWMSDPILAIQSRVLARADSGY
jgi:hypothetical protein